MKRTWFSLLLAGCLGGAELFAQDRPDRPLPAKAQRTNPAQMLSRFDKNGDGFLQRDECPPPLVERFDRFDTNRDGKLSRDELAAGIGAQGAAASRPGEVNTPPARGERHSDKLKVGDVAPDFTLPAAKGKHEVKLSGLRGKPVVLIFGSYT